MNSVKLSLRGKKQSLINYGNATRDSIVWFVNGASMHHYCRATLAMTLICSLSVSTAQSAEFSGYVGGQARVFFEDPLSPVQHNEYLSAVTEPEFNHDWAEGTQSLDVKLFYRVDQYDENRTHGDIRELSWTGVTDDWEILAGVSKVFWGVAETQHLVDIVNQTDQVENVDGFYSAGLS